MKMCWHKLCVLKTLINRQKRSSTHTGIQHTTTIYPAVLLIIIINAGFSSSFSINYEINNFAIGGKSARLGIRTIFNVFLFGNCYDSRLKAINYKNAPWMFVYGSIRFYTVYTARSINNGTESNQLIFFRQNIIRQKKSISLILNINVLLGEDIYRRHRFESSRHLKFFNMLSIMKWITKYGPIHLQVDY